MEKKESRVIDSKYIVGLVESLLNTMASVIPKLLNEEQRDPLTTLSCQATLNKMHAIILKEFLIFFKDNLGEFQDPVIVENKKSLFKKLELITALMNTFERIFEEDRLKIKQSDKYKNVTHIVDRPSEKEKEESSSSNISKKSH